MPSVEAAVERLYRAFAMVPRPGRIEGCPCCIADKKVDVLLRKPLRDLTADDLESYAFSAFNTVGCPADYRHFLPRILEITACHGRDWVDPEVTLGKIPECDLDAWTSRQRAALAGYLDAVFARVLADGPHRDVDTWICAIARSGVDVGPYLDRLGRVPAAVLAFFESNAACLPKGRLGNGFWDRRSAAHGRVVAWFATPEVARIPFEAYGYRSGPA